LAPGKGRAMMLRVILLRHGRTGLSGRYVGSTDVPLSGEGRAQMAMLGPTITAMGIETLLTSPMRRCTESLELLQLGLPVCREPDLREIDFGRWEGMSFAEIEARDPELVQGWARGGRDFCFPDGESIADFSARVEAVRRRLLTLESRTVLLVTHGGVIRALICSLLGLSLDNSLLFEVAKGHYSTIDLHSGGGVLTGLNLGMMTR
jgi:alpha-ribazole phosphatase